MRRSFKTNLHCDACVASIAPIFDADRAIKSWSADIKSSDKVVTVEGDDVSPSHVGELLARAGYQSLGEVANAPAAAAEEPKTSYFPLLLILLYLAGVVALMEWTLGGWNWDRAMAHFMAGFFLVFSFFKLLDLSSFADSYAMYDVIAKRSRGYALAYPFIELALGLAYLAHFQSILTNLATLVVMAVSAVGVVQSLLAKRQIRCACLGAVFNLPMSVVTLIEDVLMAVMAAAMLVRMAGGSV